MKKILLALAVSLSLAACAAPAPKPAPLKLDFAAESPLRLQVQSLNIVNRSVAIPGRIQVAMPPSVTDAVYQWSRDRLATTGKPGQAVLIIKEASVVAQPLPLASGFENWFKRQQSMKYTAKVELDLDARSADGMSNAYATARAMRTTTLPEDPTEAEKAQAYNDMIDGLMRDLNRDFESAIRQHMGSFLVP